MDGSRGASRPERQHISQLGLIPSHNDLSYERLYERLPLRKLTLLKQSAQLLNVLTDLTERKALLDEAPLAYKPIETVMEDSKDLVETVTVLKAFVNYKGL